MYITANVEINSNLDEQLLAELRPSDSKTSYLSDELKEKLGLTIS